MLIEEGPFEATVNQENRICFAKIQYDFGCDIMVISIRPEKTDAIEVHKIYTNCSDLTAAWRAIKIIQRLKTLCDEEKGINILNAFTAGIRQPENRSKETDPQPIINRLGLEGYQEVMSREIPEQIIQMMIYYHLESLEGSHPLIFGNAPEVAEIITEEIRAGTVAWDPEFRRLGIINPDDQEAQRIIAKYRKLLDTSDQALNMIPDFLAQHSQNLYHWLLDSQLLLLINQKADQNYPPEIVYILAKVGASLKITADTFKKMGEDEKSTNLISIIKKGSIRSIINGVFSSLAELLVEQKKGFDPAQAEEFLRQEFLKYFPEIAEEVKKLTEPKKPFGQDFLNN